MVGVEFGDDAFEVLESLKRVFGVKTNAQVVSKALTLARMVSETADDDGTILLADRNDEPVKISLR